MADNVIDTLSININSSSTGVKKSVDKVIEHFTRLEGYLNKFSGSSDNYVKSLDNLGKGLSGLSNTINKLDVSNLESASKSISRLASASGRLNNAFGNTGMDKATRDAKAMDSQIEKATKDIMSFYSTSQNVADSVGKGFRQVLSGGIFKDGRLADFSTDDGWKEFENLYNTISKNARKSAVEGGDAYYQELVDYMRGRKIPVHLPIDWSDISGDINSARSKLATVFGVGGWNFNSKSTGDISEFVKEMNEALGTQFDTSSDARAFEDLYSAISQARRELSGFSQETTTIGINMSQFIDVVSSAVGNVRQFESQMNNANSTVQDNPFSAMASGLKELQGINIPDLTGVANLAGNIGKLANKKASAGIQMLPTLSSGLQSLNSLQGITVPDLTGLAELIAVIGKLGGKKGNNATANLRPMISGLQQLSSLSGISFPDATNLASLANAFSMLGRSTTGNAIQNIPQLATAFRQLMQTLSTAPKVSQNVIALANAMAKLSANGAKVGTASRSLNTGMQKINSAFDGVMQRSKAISTRILNFGKNLLLSGRHADNTGRRYETLASKIGLLYAKFWMLIRAVKGLNGMIEVASSLTEVQNVVDTTFGKMSGKLEDFAKNSIKDFGMSELSAKQYASQFQAMGNAMGITGQQVANAQKLISTKKNASGMVAGYNEASNSMADMSINLTKLTSDMASFYDVEQSTVAKALQSGIMAGQTRPLRQYGIDLTNATLAEWAMTHGLNSNIKSMTQAEKTMLRYQYVMYQTTNAQGDFSKTANTWHNQITILKQQLQQLAAVIGSGLIQAIKPFVMQMNAALSGLIGFAQKVVNALGKIFGWQMEVNAKGMTIDDEGLGDVDESLGDIGDTADDTTNSVKKLKDQLQGFDKLNVLRTITTNPKSGKSGSGSKTPTGGGTADSGDVTAGLKKTKGLFESNIDNLFDLGRYISNALAKQLESIQWNKIYEKARNFGKGLADFLNGLITPRLFFNVGRTIANSINTAFQFLDSFGKTFNWKNFGDSIGAGINGLLYSFDWGVILSAAKVWGQGIADTINHAVGRTDFYAIGRTLMKSLETALTFAFELGNGIDFVQLGTKLADGINGALENFPAKKFADTIDVWVQGLWDLLVTTIKKIDKDKLGEKIKELVGNIDPKTWKILIGGLALIKATSFALSVGKALLEEISKQFIKKLAARLLPDMAGSKVLQDAIGGGLGKAAEGGVSGGAMTGTASAGGTISMLAGIGIAIAGLGLTSKGFFSLWDKGWNKSGIAMTTAGTGISLAGLAIAGVLTGPLALAIVGLTAGFAFFAANHEKIVDGVKKKGKEMSDSWTQLKADAKTAGSDISKEWGLMKSDFAEMGKNIATKAGELSTNAKTKFSDLKTSAGTSIGNMKKDIETKWSNLKTSVGTRMTEIKTNASNAWTNIKTTTGNLVGGKDSILSKARDGFNNIKSTISDKFNANGGIKGVVSSAWSKIASTASSAIGGSKGDSILANVKDAFGDVKTTISGVIDDIVDLLDFDWSFPSIGIPYIKKPHFTWDWKDIGGWVSVPTNFHVEWYRKAYDNPYMFTKSTITPNLKGFGDGNGGEIVYGHQNLMNDIREASGNNEMTNIGNRQLANDQRIIQLLTIIAEKEFGISQDQVFRAVRNGASDYTMRTGRSAFEF